MKRKTAAVLINILILSYTLVLFACTVSKIGSYYNSYSINTIGIIGYVSVNDYEYTDFKPGDMVFIRFTDKSGLQNGDTVLYQAEDGKLTFGIMDNVKGSIVGKCIASIPYLGAILNYAKKGTGAIIFTVVPVILIFLYIFTIIIDDFIDNKKHRKRIVRKRNRRRDRYKKEGAYGRRRAVI